MPGETIKRECYRPQNAPMSIDLQRPASLTKSQNHDIYIPIWIQIVLFFFYRLLDEGQFYSTFCLFLKTT